MMLSKISPRFLFVALSMLLLVLACTWHLPMIMYDHLDLVPMLEQFESGQLSMAKMLEWHGGHSHVAAYFVLLFTTHLSGGWLMADILASLSLLLAYSGVMCLCIRSVANDDEGSRRHLLLLTIAMTLSTLHLPNLIWGWQVAVFINLLGLALGLAAVCFPLSWMARLLLGTLGLSLAVSSFATGAALLPAMLAGLVFSKEISMIQKTALLLIWAMLLSWLMHHLHFFSQGMQTGSVQVAGILLYAVNYLGGGIVRFATVFSIPVVILGLAMLWIAQKDLVQRSRPLVSFWSMLAVFSVGAAALTAYGRYEVYGANQAWVIRYGSFAGLFWFSVIGAMLSAGHWRHENRLKRYGVKALVFMFAFNSLHFIPQARDFSNDAKDLARIVQRDWPEVKQDTLEKLYPTDPAVALHGLQYLNRKGLPPFRHDLDS